VREWCWNETPEGRAIRGGSWEDNTYEFGNLRHAPPLDRSARNGVRLAWYPDRESIPETAFAFRDVGPQHPSAVPPVPEPVFQAYRERFAYDPADLAARLESRQETPGSWAHETVSFRAAYGNERVPAHLFLPANARPP
jgi:hypothetical protein